MVGPPPPPPPPPVPHPPHPRPLYQPLLILPPPPLYSCSSHSSFPSVPHLASPSLAPHRSVLPHARPILPDNDESTRDLNLNQATCALQGGRGGAGGIGGGNRCISDSIRCVFTRSRKCLSEIKITPAAKTLKQQNLIWHDSS